MTDKTRLQNVIKKWADERTNLNGSHVPLVENSSTQAVAGGENTATKPADKPATGKDANSARYGDMLTQQGQGNSRFYRPEGFTRNCDHCGQKYTAKRDTSRFCSTNCRVAAHKARHEGEAGGGRVQTFIWLAVSVAALWFFWPLLQQISAMRPTLAPTPTAVPAYVETWPDPAPTAVPQAMPETAVNPAPAVVPVDQGQPTPAPAVVTNDVKPAPATAVYQELPTVRPANPEVAATAGAALLHITAGGRVYEITGERLIDCINAQQNGQRTGPSCPPNAAQYAGMLGQGR